MIYTDERFYILFYMIWTAIADSSCVQVLEWVTTQLWVRVLALTTWRSVMAPAPSATAAPPPPPPSPPPTPSLSSSYCIGMVWWVMRVRGS